MIEIDQDRRQPLPPAWAIVRWRPARRAAKRIN